MIWALAVVIALQLLLLFLSVCWMSDLSDSLSALRKEIEQIREKERAPFSGFTLTDMARAKLRAKKNGEGRPTKLPSLTGIDGENAH